MAAKDRRRLEGGHHEHVIGSLLTTLVTHTIRSAVNVSGKVA